MGPKRNLRGMRWRPLGPLASFMQVMVLPEVDEHVFHPDDMTMEDLHRCNKVIEQSNETIELENSILEKYLSRVDPGALAKMAQVMEAAVATLQKAEKPSHLGATGSNLSIPKEGVTSRLTAESLSSSSKGGTGKSISGVVRSTKLGFYALPEKGPRVNTDQKLEIVSRETEELKTALEKYRQKARDFNYVLRCRYEEMAERLQEWKEAKIEFEQKLLIEGLDPMTGKLPAEKFYRYLEKRLKDKEIQIDRMRIKTGSLKIHLKRVRHQLAQKEELGEVLHAVDFEQLQIENRDCQERLDERVAHVIDIKRINGKFGTLLNINKKKLHEQMNRLATLQENAKVKEKMVKQLMTEERKVNSEVRAAEKQVDKIIRLMKSYTVPDLSEYILKKAELHDLKKELKVCERQVKLKDLALAAQIHKKKSMPEVFSKSLGSTFSTFKQSSIFF